MLRRFLDRFGLGDFVARFVRLDPHPHCIFDWYAAPIATHHTYQEVESWMTRMDFTIVADNKPLQASKWPRTVRAIAGGSQTVTVRAMRH
jgi:hypothetical protein